MPLLARLKAFKEFHTGIERIRDAGGPVTMVRLGPSRLVPTFAIVTSPQGAHDVLAASDALDKEMVIQVENRIFGDNLFNMNHAAWLSRKRALQPVFTKKHVAAYAAGMAAAADRTAGRLVDAGEVDLDGEMRRLALGVITSSVFGLDAGDQARELAPAILRMLEWNTKRGLRPVRAPIWLPTPARSRLRRAVAQVDAYIDDAIDATSDPDHPADLIRQLQQALDPTTGRPLTREQIRSELYVFFLAGHDTTATTLTYALWALGRDQDLQARVAAEVTALGDRELTVADVERLPLTIKVLHESMRLCPPAAAIGRLALRDVTVDGYRIPAGTNVIVGCYAMHRDPQLWEDPLRFDPERFDPERSAGRSRWQYLPFGAGPRSCIGDHFAMLEATLGLASIIRTALIESLKDDFPMAIPFTLCAAEPIPARISRRTGAPERSPR
ncbi:cytochrome P450 [Nocardioides marmorisolisilvae]|uniref:Cytochrome P450 n=2 Tax=Nocardioides marmorisolisilvae TaxID=1542737 RepID=A0A3N0DQA1_9ACTN|nr:cytochrome P450 [Nocardioides marmorisolisilvae]